MAADLFLFHIWFEGLIGFYNFSLLLYMLRTRTVCIISEAANTAYIVVKEGCVEAPL
jgi:hypothetical protein